MVLSVCAVIHHIYTYTDLEVGEVMKRGINIETLLSTKTELFVECVC